MSHVTLQPIRYQDVYQFFRHVQLFMSDSVSSCRCVHADCAVGWQGEDKAGLEDYLCSTCRPQEGQPEPDRPAPSPLPTDAVHKDSSPPHLPAPLVSLEPPPHPLSPHCPSLQAELHHCPSPPHQDPAHPHDPPAPCQAESTALQLSSAVPSLGPPDPSQQSELVLSEETDICSFQALPHPDHLLRQSPSALPGGAEELQSSPPPSRHSPDQQLDSPAPPQLSHPDHSQAACHAHPGEHHHRLDSEPSHPQPTEPQQSPVAPEEDRPESQRSPSPHHLEPQSPRPSPAPLHPNTVEPGSSPTASQAKLTQEGLQPGDEEPAEVHHSPGSVEHTHPQEPSVCHNSPASLQLPATETPLSPSQPQADPPAAHLHPTKLLHSPEPREHLDDIAQLHYDSTEFQSRLEHLELPGSPAAPLAKDLDTPQDLPAPHSEPAKLHTTAVSPQASPETKPASPGPQGDLEGTNSSPAEHPGGPTLAWDDGPTEMQGSESSAQLIQIEPSCGQLSPSSPTAVSTSTEEQLIATTAPSSPVHCSSSDARSPPSPAQIQLGSTSLQTLAAPPCPSQPFECPTDDCGPPLEQEPPGSSEQLLPQVGTHTVFQLPPNDSALSGGSGAVMKHTPSAPCSPSASQLPTKASVSVSQPASPVLSQLQLAPSQLAVQSGVILEGTSRRPQEELDCPSIQTGPQQPVDTCLASVSPASILSMDEREDKLPENPAPAGSGGAGLGQSSSAPGPLSPTPPGLVPPAAEDVLPAPPQSPGGSLSPCTQAADMVQKSPTGSSPPHTAQMPPPSAASAPAGPSPASDSSSGQLRRPSESVRSPERPGFSSAGTPHPASLNWCQSDESPAAPHPHPADPGPDSLDHVSICSEAVRTRDAPGGPDDQEKIVSASAEDNQTNGSPTPAAQPSHGPSLTTSLTSCSPVPVENPSQGSPSSGSGFESSLAQTIAGLDSSPHSLAQSSHCGPHQSPVLHTGTSPGPDTSLNADRGASLLMLDSLVPDLAQSESGPNKADLVGEMIPEPVGSSLWNQSIVSSPSPDRPSHTLQLGVCEASRSPPGLASSPRAPGSSGPTQVNSSSCSSIPGASAGARALSRHTGTSSPAGQLLTDTQVRPSPESSPSEEPPTDPVPALRGSAALTQKVPAQREPAAEGESRVEGGKSSAEDNSDLLTLVFS